MKIVIDIPKRYYEDFKLQLPVLNRAVPSENAKYVIATGTPLPEGHGRIIDADRLQAEMDKDVRRAMSFMDLRDFVWLAPTIVEADKLESEKK